MATPQQRPNVDYEARQSKREELSRHRKKKKIDKTGEIKMMSSQNETRLDLESTIKWKEPFIRIEQLRRKKMS